MKRLAHIVVLFLSFLIIYLGAGVAIVHYCCHHCEEVQSNCCTSGCSHNEESHSCKPDEYYLNITKATESGCTATIYKLNLMQHTPELIVKAPFITLFDKFISCLPIVGYPEKPSFCAYHASPPPQCVRQKLVLHSVFII